MIFLGKKKKEIPFNIFLSSRVFGTPVLWSPHVKSWLIGKDSDAGRDWEQEEKGTAEDEMAGWHHWLNGCKSEWIPGVGDGQGGLACCDSWSRKESATTEQLNWTELAFTFIFWKQPHKALCPICIKFPFSYRFMSTLHDVDAKMSS